MENRRRTFSTSGIGGAGGGGGGGGNRPGISARSGSLSGDLDHHGVSGSLPGTLSGPISAKPMMGPMSGGVTGVWGMPQPMGVVSGGVMGESGESGIPGSVPGVLPMSGNYGGILGPQSGNVGMLSEGALSGNEPVGVLGPLSEEMVSESGNISAGLLDDETGPLLGSESGNLSVGLGAPVSAELLDDETGPLLGNGISGGLGAPSGTILGGSDSDDSRSSISRSDFEGIPSIIYTSDDSADIGRSDSTCVDSDAPGYIARHVQLQDDEASHRLLLDSENSSPQPSPQPPIDAIYLTHPLAAGSNMNFDLPDDIDLEKQGNRDGCGYKRSQSLSSSSSSSSPEAQQPLLLEYQPLSDYPCVEELPPRKMNLVTYIKEHDPLDIFVDVTQIPEKKQPLMSGRYMVDSDVHIDGHYSDFCYVHWNWTYIRHTCVFVNMSILMALLFVGIALLIKMPHGLDCQPTHLWYQGSVLMHIDVPKYTDSDGDGIGDLPGVLSSLHHIQSLGVRGIRLGGILNMGHTHPTGDTRLDLTSIDPALGSSTHIYDLTSLLHSTGLYLILDVPLDGVDNLGDIDMVLKAWLALGVDGFYLTGIEKHAQDFTQEIHNWRNILDFHTHGFNHKILMVPLPVLVGLSNSPRLSHLLTQVDLIDVKVNLNSTAEVIPDILKIATDWDSQAAFPWIHWSIEQESHNTITQLPHINTEQVNKSEQDTEEREMNSGDQGNNAEQMNGKPNDEIETKRINNKNEEQLNKHPEQNKYKSNHERTQEQNRFDEIEQDGEQGIEGKSSSEGVEGGEGEGEMEKGGEGEGEMEKGREGGKREKRSASEFEEREVRDEEKEGGTGGEKESDGRRDDEKEREGRRDDEEKREGGRNGEEKEGAKLERIELDKEWVRKRGPQIKTADKHGVTEEMRGWGEVDMEGVNKLKHLGIQTDTLEIGEKIGKHNDEHWPSLGKTILGLFFPGTVSLYCCGELGPLMRQESSHKPVLASMQDWTKQNLTQNLIKNDLIGNINLMENIDGMKNNLTPNIDAKKNNLTPNINAKKNMIENGSENAYNNSLNTLTTMIIARQEKVPIYVNGIFDYEGDYHPSKSTNYRIRHADKELIVLDRFYPRRNQYAVVANLGQNPLQVDISRFYYGGSVLASSHGHEGYVTFRDLKLQPGEALACVLDL